MDWFDLLVKGLVAITAIAGAVTAFFAWRSRRKVHGGEVPKRSSINKTVSMNAGRDINIIDKSFNRFIGGKDGR